jgi:hypothetical protein
MAGQPVEKTIGTTTYIITPFGARKGLRASFLLTKLMGGAVAMLTQGDIAGAVTAWASTARFEDFEAVCKELEDCTEIVIPVSESGTTIKQPLSKFFDSHFAGRYDEMALWIVEAIKVNFASFFSGSAGSALLTKLNQGTLQSPPPKA